MRLVPGSLAQLVFLSFLCPVPTLEVPHPALSTTLLLWWFPSLSLLSSNHLRLGVLTLALDGTELALTFGEKTDTPGALWVLTPFMSMTVRCQSLSCRVWGSS